MGAWAIWTCWTDLIHFTWLDYLLEINSVQLRFSTMNLHIPVCSLVDAEEMNEVIACVSINFVWNPRISDHLDPNQDSFQLVFVWYAIFACSSNTNSIARFWFQFSDWNRTFQVWLSSLSYLLPLIIIIIIIMEIKISFIVNDRTIMWSSSLSPWIHIIHSRQTSRNKLIVYKSHCSIKHLITENRLKILRNV